MKKNKKYDNWEFKQILSIMKTDPIEARLKCEEYLRKYPTDYGTYPYYVSCLITLGEFTLAKKIIDYLEIITNDANSFQKDSKKLRIIKNDIVYVKLRLLCYQEKYEELYQYYLDNFEVVRKLKLKEVLLYCKKKLGKINYEQREYYSYIFRQVLEYQESDFLEHIQKHLADYNKDIDNPNNNIFVPNFPINEVLQEIKKYIPSDKRLFPGFLDDAYIFRYEGCGRENNKLVDYFKASCFHNTSDIFTIVPISNCENLPYIDLNYLIDKKETIKIRRKSQIDKFNQRYVK